jgi:hypothetical protein
MVQDDDAARFPRAADRTTRIPAMSISGKQPGMASEFSVKEKNVNQQDIHEAGTIESIQPSLLKRVDAWLRVESAGPKSDLGPWSNADLEPTAASQQTWSSWNCKCRKILRRSSNTDVPQSWHTGSVMRSLPAILGLDPP